MFKGGLGTRLVNTCNRSWEYSFTLCVKFALCGVLIYPLKPSQAVKNYNIMTQINRWVVTLVAGDSGYEKFILVLEVNYVSNLSPNQTLQLTTLRTSVSESLQVHFKNMMLLWWFSSRCSMVISGLKIYFFNTSQKWSGCLKLPWETRKTWEIFLLLQWHGNAFATLISEVLGSIHTLWYMQVLPLVDCLGSFLSCFLIQLANK